MFILLFLTQTKNNLGNRFIKSIKFMTITYIGMHIIIFNSNTKVIDKMNELIIYMCVPVRFLTR